RTADRAASLSRASWANPNDVPSAAAATARTPRPASRRRPDGSTIRIRGGSLVAFGTAFRWPRRAEARCYTGAPRETRVRIFMGRLAEFAGNHVWLVSGLIASWLAVMFYEIRLRAQGTTHVTPADAVRLINKGALVIDVRKPEEFEQ